MCVYLLYMFPIVTMLSGLESGKPSYNATLSCPPSGHAVASWVARFQLDQSWWIFTVRSQEAAFWLADCRGETDGKLSTARTGNRQYTWSLPVSEKGTQRDHASLDKGTGGWKVRHFNVSSFIFALEIFLMAGLGFWVAARSLWSLSRDDKSCSYAGFVCFVMSDVNTCCGSCWGSSLAQENEQL